MFVTLNGVEVGQTGEAAFSAAAAAIYANPSLSLEQRQAAIVDAYKATGVTATFAAQTFNIPVSDVLTVVQRESEKDFAQAASYIYKNLADLPLDQKQQMIVQALVDTGVSDQFAAQTFGIPVSDVQAVIARHIKSVTDPVPPPMPAAAYYTPPADYTPGPGQPGYVTPDAPSPIEPPPAQFCPPGKKMENGVCVVDTSTYGPTGKTTDTAEKSMFSSPLTLAAIAAGLFLMGQ